MQVFEKRFTFVELVALTGEGVLFQLHPRLDGQNVAARIRVWDDEGRRIMDASSDSLKPVPPQGKWRARVKIPEGSFSIQIHLEDCLAYHAQLVRSEDLF
jgi:hypothetical protein